MKLSKIELKKIEGAITLAEQKTSGEIRVHLDYSSEKKEPLLKARELFEKLKMHQTLERNSVLIYFNLNIRTFALFGDQGIHEKLKADYWEALAKRIQEAIQENSAINGIILAVEKTGSALAEHFPVTSKKRNELANDVSESD